MDNCIMQRHEFVITKVSGCDFIVINKNKQWSKGHSHLKSYNACISAIKLVERKEIPKSKSKYFIQSLIRISTDKEYINLLKNILVDLSVNYQLLMERTNDIDTRRCK